MENCGSGSTRAAAALVDSAPWDKTDAPAASEVGGAGSLGGSLPRDGGAGASAVGGNTGGASAVSGNTGGAALGRDEVVVYISGGLRTCCCPCHTVYIYLRVCIYVCLSIGLNISFYLAIYRSIYIYLSISISIDRSVYLSFSG